MTLLELASPPSVDRVARLSAALATVLGSQQLLEELARVAALVVAIVTATGTLYSKIVKIETTNASLLDQIAATNAAWREQLAALVKENSEQAERIRLLEGDRRMLERVHSIERDLGTIKFQLSSIADLVRKKRDSDDG